MTDPGSHATRPAPRPGFIRRHRGWFIAFLSLVLVLILIVVGFAWILNKSVNDVARVPVKLNPDTRPSPDNSRDLNILLLGADAGKSRNGPDTSIIRDAESSTWPRGKYRSDATMLMHIAADRKKAYIISIPRDSYVPLYDGTGQKRSRQKINAALSLHGPSGAIATVENFIDQRIDHMAMIDWDGFEDITDAVGGVSLAVPGHGKVQLDGKKALGYVRERYKLPEGDFDRVRRQQNFLRAVMSKMISKGTMTNPVKLTKTVKAVTKNMAVDADWSTSEMRSLAWAMRNVRTSDVTFLTIPIQGTKNDPEVGSIDIVDKDGCEDLFKALEDDDVDAFLTSYPHTRLGAPGSVN